MICDRSLTSNIDRHRISSKRLQKGLQGNIGLEMFVEQSKYRLPTVVAVKIPHGIDDKQFAKYLMERFVLSPQPLQSTSGLAALTFFSIRFRHSLEISTGMGATTGQIFRIGLMNENAAQRNVDFILRAFYDALQTMIPNYVVPTANTYFY